MKYRSNKAGEDISILGYGCLRFTKKNGNIDIDKTEKEIMAAINAGVNYFDTAYIYAGSEAALGEILEKNCCRDKINIATKLPHYLIKSAKSLDKYFNEELIRLKTDYVDYYLMHMLTDVNTWERMKGLGIEDWIAQKKASGQIRHIGFSYHGSTDMFIRLVDVYPWDFCQIQYNYMDEHSQAGRKGLQYASQKGIPVIIMEPLRGGKLVNMLPETTKEIFSRNEKNYSPAEWAFRWLWDQPEVTCVLSGMNSMEMVKENIRIASEVEVHAFTKEDFTVIEEIKSEINKNIKVGCTACGYCMPCPQGVDIPGTFRCYNEMYMESKKNGRWEYLQCTILRSKPSSASQCVCCGKCEKHCPQQIQIQQKLKEAVKQLETPKYKIAKKIIQWFRLW